MTAPKPVELVTEPSPHELRDPEMRFELRRAGVWLGLAAVMALVVILIQPILVILAGLVFASMLDGGVRLLGRYLKIPRGWRLLIVVVLTVLFIVVTVYQTGAGIVVQFKQLQATLMIQFDRLSQWAAGQGIVPGADDFKGLAQQAMGSVGKLTSWIGTALGAISTLFIIMVIGLFVAMEPRIYDRGLQWMVPTDQRAEFALTLDRMARQLRRLLAGRLAGMAFEGVLIWLALMLGGVPMALVLGIIAGMLAFIPNIGAFITGVLMVAVGFSAGVHEGLWAIGTYVVVQTFDGWVVIPLVAKRTVDLPPALTLSMQILFSALFGILGLALADPLTAMIKVAMGTQFGARDGDGARPQPQAATAKADEDGMIRLYDYWRSSASYRVRIVLAMKGIAYERHDINLLAGEQGEGANRARNAQGFVPTLEVDGQTIGQSLAIIDYLDAIYPDPPMVPRDPLARARTLQRALVIAADIHPVDNLRVLKRLSAMGIDQAGRDDWYRHWIAEGFAALEAMAGEGRYLGGDAPDLSDVCLVPQMYNARRLETPLDAYPKLVAIDAALTALPAFAAAHPDKFSPT